MTARRIQRQRVKGWRLPAGAVYVGRPTRWGNPFVVGAKIGRESPLWPYLTMPGRPRTLLDGFTSVRIGSAETAVEMYGWWVLEQPQLMLTVVPALGGHNLVCWCPTDQPCHADVLLKLANGDPPYTTQADLQPLDHLRAVTSA